MKRRGSLPALGSAPTVEDVDAWLQRSMGLTAKVVGQSYQGRDLLLYEWVENDNNNNTTLLAPDDDPRPAILYVSLLHGNEPMGLWALLTAVETFQRQQNIQQRSPFRSRTSSSSSSRHHHKSTPLHEARLLFFPMVNVDAYTLNLPKGTGGGGGCRRTNLRPTCSSKSSRQETHPSTTRTSALVTQCPEITHDGVDLERNFAFEPWNMSKDQENNSDTWLGTTLMRTGDSDDAGAACSPVYPGEHPFSEPETLALRQVVLEYRVEAALVFHSRSGHQGRHPLLIHPYASPRPLHQMPPDDLARFRQWCHSLNQQSGGIYQVGNAQQTVGYTASGTSLDWMYSVRGIMAVVLEVVPPCENRWCPPPDLHRIIHAARPHGVTATRWANLAIHHHWQQHDHENSGSASLAWPLNHDTNDQGGGQFLLMIMLLPLLTVCLVLLLSTGRRRRRRTASIFHSCMTFWRRRWVAQAKYGRPDDMELEMYPLTRS